MAESNDKLRPALEAARNGLQWYRDRFPEADSGADDEMMAQIEDALDSKAATPAHEGMTVAGDGASMLGELMRQQWASRGGVYPDGNPNAQQRRPSWADEQAQFFGVPVEQITAPVAAVPAPQALGATEVPELSQAARDVLAERRRQIEAEGWTPEHDDEHNRGALARAAACYALGSQSVSTGRPYNTFVTIWPWEMGWWKPTPNDRRRELAKAGALILAELERLDRNPSEGGAA